MKRKCKIKPCPSSFLCFLKGKDLLKKDLLFSERMELEKEFYEWCEEALK